MRLLSVDIETTGLDPVSCSVLEIGCVVFDPQPAIGGLHPDTRPRRWRTFEYLINHTRIQGEPYAIGMNADVINEIAGRKETHIPIGNVTEVIANLYEFLTTYSDGGKYTIVGKNYDAFDGRFLDRLPGWATRIKPLCERRTLDLGSLCFDPTDGRVPNLTECLHKLGIRDDVKHRALGDALQVATGITRFFVE